MGLFIQRIKFSSPSCYRVIPKLGEPAEDETCRVVNNWNRLPFTVVSAHRISANSKNYQTHMFIYTHSFFLFILFSPQYGLFGHFVPFRSVNTYMYTYKQSHIRFKSLRSISLISDKQFCIVIMFSVFTKRKIQQTKPFICWVGG